MLKNNRSESFGGAADLVGTLSLTMLRNCSIPVDGNKIFKYLRSGLLLKQQKALIPFVGIRFRGLIREKPPNIRVIDRRGLRTLHCMI